MVLHCADFPSGPQPELTIDRDGPGPVCATHKNRIDDGEPWLWVPWNRLKGVGSDMSEGCVLMGEELAGYGLVVDAEVHLSTSLVFSPVLAEGRQTATLAIEGRLFGADQLVSLELVLDPEAVAVLKEALRFLRS
ncbi:MAG TPA: hypothetical protein VFO16_08865 [Pseudonocardiaceae bacterium]|nr:hypothetical protein [Pseudonocardiaceae bacterium]